VGVAVLGQRPFPEMCLEHAAQEVLEAVRPGLQMHGSYDEAAAAVEALEAADAAAQRSRGGLATVAEDEEAGDSGDEEAGDSAAGSDDEGARPSMDNPI
jgi:hypothetical protein